MKINPMRFVIGGTSVCAVLVGLLPALSAQQVRTDYDKSKNFQQYHSHYWARVQTPSALRDKRVQQAIEAQLDQKGLVEGNRWRRCRDRCVGNDKGQAKSSDLLHRRSMDVVRDGWPPHHLETTEKELWWSLFTTTILVSCSGEFPPRQKAASFTIDQAMEKMEATFAGGPATTAKAA